MLNIQNPNWKEDQFDIFNQIMSKIKIELDSISKFH